MGIDNVNISYSDGGVRYSMDVDVSYDSNPVYNMADAVSHLIDHLDLNVEMFLDELCGRYGYDAVEFKDSGESNNGK